MQNENADKCCRHHKIKSPDITLSIARIIHIYLSKKMTEINNNEIKLDFSCSFHIAHTRKA